MIVPVMAISNLVLTRQIYSDETNGAHAHYREPVPLKALTNLTCLGLYWVILVLHCSCMGLLLCSVLNNLGPILPSNGSMAYMYVLSLAVLSKVGGYWTWRFFVDGVF